MKIRLNLIRPGGTEVTFGPNHERRYHFKPLDPAFPNADHVAEVGNDDDALRLLSIQGYEEYEGDGSGEDAKYADVSIKELIERIAKITGRKPHPKTSRSNLIAALEALPPNPGEGEGFSEGDGSGEDDEQ